MTHRGLLYGWFLLGVGFTLATCPASEAQDKPADTKPLLWAADAEGGAPYIYKDPKDPKRLIGFEVDIARALEKELGRRIEHKQYDYKNLTLGLERGDFDFAMNGLEVTPDRQKKMLFSRPYYVYKLQLVVRADEERFKTLKGCKKAGGVVGTLDDTAAERLLDQLGIKKKVYDGQVEPYQDLALGREIDAVLLDLPIASHFAKPNKKLKFASTLSGRGYYAIAFRKQNTALKQKVDAALGRLLEKGALRRIYQKWNIWNDNQEELMPAGQFSDEDAAQDESTTAGPQTYQFTDYFLQLLEAAELTVRISILGMLLAILLALPISLARLYGPGPLRWLALLYVEFFRGIPVLLLLVFLYFGLPVIAEHYELGVSLELSPMTAAVLGFGLNYAAYEAEIYRAGIGAIPAGQWEAAASLGMSGTLTFRRIILPQALRVILPPMTNDFVALFKDTSVVSVIAVVELTKQYQILAKSSGEYLMIGLTTAALYLIMSVPLGYVSRYLEQRWGTHL